MYLEITSANALNSGAQLWFIPKRNHSTWTSKVDWYLGFQLTKNLTRQMPKISKHLQSIIKTNQLEELSSSISKEYKYPVFIVPQSTFPTDVVVKYDSDLSLDKWVGEIKHIWRNLKTPSLRVFLPSNAIEEDFLKYWSEEHVQLGIVTSKKQ